MSLILFNKSGLDFINSGIENFNLLCFFETKTSLSVFEWMPFPVINKISKYFSSKHEWISSLTFKLASSKLYPWRSNLNL